MMKTAVLAVGLMMLTGFAVAGPPGMLSQTQGGPGDGGPPPGAGEGRNGGSTCLPGDAFESDDVRIWFHGDKAQVKVFDKDENGHVKVYQYKAFQFAELDDDDNTLAWMNLERASQLESSCGTSEDETFVNITFVATDTVYEASGHPIGQATVTWEYHFNKTSDTAKFDILLNDWPWQADGSELAYLFEIETDLTMETAENGIGFRDDDGEARGFIEFAMNATARYDDGHQEEAIVDSHVGPGSGEADGLVSLRFTNATAGYHELEYDPWIGSGGYVIVGGILMIGTHRLPEPVREIVEDLL